jgi:hypothetical protein
MARCTKSTLLKSIFIFLVAALLSGCKGGEIYPVIPAIEFESAYLTKDTARSITYIGLIFRFTDGDGDIGLEDGDTLPPYNIIKDPTDSNKKNINFYYNNLHIEYLEKRGNKYDYAINPFNGDTLKKEIRVMNITPEGKFKAIRGTIDVQFEPSIFDNRADTVKLRFRLVDRMLHISNTAESTDIVLSE